MWNRIYYGIMTPIWHLKNALCLVFGYLKRPYFISRPTHPCDRFESWHEHYCLMLRLGKSMFEYACPHANEKDFDFEYEDECDTCPYHVTMEVRNGKVVFFGDKRFLIPGW